MKKNFKLYPKIVIIISVIIGLVMVISAFLELNESKKEIYHVLEEQASSLIQTVSLSSINTLNSSYEIEDLIAERLIDNARLIKSLDSLNLLSQRGLIKIGRENHLFRINIFDIKGNRILSNRIPIEGHIEPAGKVNRFDELEPILTGKSDQLILGLKSAQYSEGQRYAVAIARSAHRGAIVINLDAEEFLQFRKKIGIGKMIQDIGMNRGIEYIILQDSLGILAATSSVKSVNSIENDEFLIKAMSSDSVVFRKHNFDGHQVFEAVKSVKIGNDLIGLYRVGISLDEIRNVESRMYSRIILISLLLAAISVIVLSIIFTSQNLKTVSLEYNKFKTFASSVLHNMAEAVIVLDRNLDITFFNDSAEMLFNTGRTEIVGKNLNDLAEGKLGPVISGHIKAGDFKSELQVFIELEMKERYLNINIADGRNQLNEIENYTLVISDYTERKKLELQAERNEKLTAMGELASGVAHEIRNPVNAIGMIAQRLNREFIPQKDGEEYQNITKLLKDEVSRINKIITQFLSYAKPLDLQCTNINSKEYFEEILRLFSGQAKERNINMKLSLNNVKNLYIDPELMKQTMMNILQNSIDAVAGGGTVSIGLSKTENEITIEITDTGCGISEENIKKVFDLYFTTKKEGNGLGLSIAQKIIDQHNGRTEIESRLNQGTTFKIRLPST